MPSSFSLSSGFPDSSVCSLLLGCCRRVLRPQAAKHPPLWNAEHPLVSTIGASTHAWLLWPSHRSSPGQALYTPTPPGRVSTRQAVKPSPPWSGANVSFRCAEPRCLNMTAPDSGLSISGSCFGRAPDASSLPSTFSPREPSGPASGSLTFCCLGSLSPTISSLASPDLPTGRALESAILSERK